MKKSSVLLCLVTLLALTLAAGVVSQRSSQDVYWSVNSDNSCSTFFYVGSHTESVKIMQLQVNSDLTPYYGATWVEIDTLGVNDHNLSSSECANFRYLYKLVCA
ncbi:MAG: hypothetical protein GY757_51630, partial [bacterium]|nr:hypothetical protein [bacterium]